MYNEDDFYEPSNEFQTALDELIKNEVETRIKETVSQLEQARKTINVYTQRNNELMREKRELENGFKSALVEKEKEVKRSIFGGCNVGDYVYIPDGKGKKSVPCSDCGGSKKVLAVFNNKETLIQCPSCNNKNYFQSTVFEYTPRKMKVTQITFKVWDDGKSKDAKAYLNSDFERSLDDIFLTEEECQTRCDEMNAKEREKLGN